MLGREARREGRRRSSSRPTVNLHRTPIGGRNFECFDRGPACSRRASPSPTCAAVQAHRVAVVHQALRRQRHRVRAQSRSPARSTSARCARRTSCRSRTPSPLDEGGADVRSVMSSYNRAQRHVRRRAPVRCCTTCCATSGTSTASCSATGSARTRRPSRSRPGSTSRCRVRPRTAARSSSPRCAPARWPSATSTSRCAACCSCPSGAGRRLDAAGRTDESDRRLGRDARAHPPRRGRAATVLLKNDGVLPLGRPARGSRSSDRTRDAGQTHGGGSARGAPVPHPSRPLDALRDRGVDVATSRAPRSTRACRRCCAARPEPRSSSRRGGETVATTPSTACGFFWLGTPTPEVDATASGRAITGDVRARGRRRVDVRRSRRSARSRVVGRRRRRRRQLDGPSGQRVLRRRQHRGHRHRRARGRAYRATSSSSSTRTRTSVRRAAASAPSRRRPTTPFDRAVAAAAAAEVAIVVVGTNDDWETEGNDRIAHGPARSTRTSWSRAVAAVNPRTVVVLNTGLAGPDAVARRRRRRAAGVVRRARSSATGWPTCCWATPSPAAGCRSRFPSRLEDTPGVPLAIPARRPGAVRRGAVLRLPLVRRPRHRAAVPVRARPRLHDVRSSARPTVSGSIAGRRGCACRRGHQHRRPRRVDSGAVLRRAAATRATTTAAAHAAGVRQGGAGPGASTTVELTLDQRAFATWDVATHAWVVPAGAYGIAVGTSSRQLASAGSIEAGGIAG